MNFDKDHLRILKCMVDGLDKGEFDWTIPKLMQVTNMHRGKISSKVGELNGMGALCEYRKGRSLYYSLKEINDVIKKTQKILRQKLN